MKLKFLASIALVACTFVACDDTTEGIGTSLTDNADKLSVSTATFTASTKSVMAKTTEQFDLTLLKLIYKVEFDYDTLGSKYTNNEFLSRFCSIRFIVNGKEYNNRLDLMDSTPYYTNDYSILQVRDKLKLAEKIYLDFNIRDKVYSYVIFDKTVKNEGKEGE